MKVSVWDTYVQRKDGKTMHFDILVPSILNDEEKIFQYGNQYLSRKSFETDELNSKRCNFCHIEKASEAVINEIVKQGYSIIEMENCY